MQTTTNKPFAVIAWWRNEFRGGHNVTDRGTSIYETQSDLANTLTNRPTLLTRAQEIEICGDQEGFEDQYGEVIAADETYAFHVVDGGALDDWYETEADAEEALREALVETYIREFDRSGYQGCQVLYVGDAGYAEAVQ